MAKEMLINVSQGEECRIALVENGRLEELYMERSSSTSHVGNIYKGKVTNVEPSIQAAFIDFGLGRNGFLHISDLMPTYFGHGEDFKESVGRKLARRDRPPIQRCLRRGDDIIVQIIKEGIGTKGPTLTTYLSIPGRILVMMPGMSKLGVSRKIEDEEERRRLRQILDSLKPPREAGFIIRTAGVGKSKADIQKDLTYLARLGQVIEKKRKSSSGPVELYTEGDLVTRTVRDVFTPDIERIIIDNEIVADRVRDFIKIAMPRTKNKVELHTDPVPLFHKYNIESEIEMMNSRYVPLPSGGSLVIDSTEAVVAIDVNSGKFRDHSDAETTAFKTDIEAADEIPRQLRLRDLGGVIICDFIDLRYERHRRDLEKKLQDNLHKDRAKTRMLRMSQFGIIEMTRQRMRPSLKRSIYFDCPHCKGAGLVKTSESMALDVMRRLAIAMNDARVQRVELAVSPEVAFYLQNRKRSGIVSLENKFKKNVVIRSDATIGLDTLNFQLFDSREGLVFLTELGMIQPSAPGMPPQQQHRHGGKHQGHQEHRDDRRGGNRHHRDDERHQDHDADPEDRFDLDLVEDAVDQREVEQSREPEEPPMPMDAPAEIEIGKDEHFPEPSFDLDETLDDDLEEIEPEPQSVQPAPKPIAPPTPPRPVMPPRPVTPPRPVAPPAPVATPAPVAKPAQPAPAPQPKPQPSFQHKSTRVYSTSLDTMSNFRGRRGRGRGRGGPSPRPPIGGFVKPAAPSPQNAQPAPAGEPRKFEPVVVTPPPQPTPSHVVIAPPPPPPPAPVVIEEAPAKDEKPKKRGGRKAAAPKTPAKRGRKPKAAKNESGKDNSGPMVIRPSASDKHLLDEPVLPPPVYKPRTYRDMDHIDDDQD